MLYITFVIIGGPLALFFHELSHAIIVWLYKGKITSFKFWPHKYKGKWRLGAVKFENNLPLQKAIAFLCWFYSAPGHKAALFSGIYAIIGMLIHPSFFVLALCELIDLANWWRGYFQILGAGSTFDGARFKTFFNLVRIYKSSESSK